MRQSYLPSRETELAVWANIFVPAVQAEAAALNLPPALVAELVACQLAYAAALKAARSGDSRTPAALVRKNQAKADLKRIAHAVAELLKAQVGHDNALLARLQLTVPKRTRTPIAAPAEAPVLRVSGVHGRAVRLGLFAGDAAVRPGRAAGATSAQVFGYVGETYPHAVDAWLFLGAHSQARCGVKFPKGHAAGTKVWLAARWVSRRSELSPMSGPIYTHLTYAVECDGAAA